VSSAFFLLSFYILLYRKGNRRSSHVNDTIISSNLFLSLSLCSCEDFKRNGDRANFYIISDRGSLFTSDFWKRVTEALGISCNLSTAFHTQTDGQTERANATLEQYLRAYCNYQQDDWERLLPIAEFCYNNTQTGTTKITPFFANYRYQPRFLPDLGTRNDETPEVSEYVEVLRKLHEDLRAEIKEAQMARMEQANKA